MSDTDYRKTLGSFMTGVSVLGAFDEERVPWGLTANSFTSVSLNPRLILVCLDRRGRAWHVFERAETFSVNILSSAQEDLARHFASRTKNRFAGVEWRGEDAPLLLDTSAWLLCRTERRIDAGDHELLLAEVEAFGNADIAPLGFCRGTFLTSIDVSSEQETA